MMSFLQSIPERLQHIYIPNLKSWRKTEINIEILWNVENMISFMKHIPLPFPS